MPPAGHPTSVADRLLQDLQASLRKEQDDFQRLLERQTKVHRQRQEELVAGFAARLRSSAQQGGSPKMENGDGAQEAHHRPRPNGSWSAGTVEELRVQAPWVLGCARGEEQDVVEKLAASIVVPLNAALQRVEDLLLRQQADPDPPGATERGVEDQDVILESDDLDAVHSGMDADHSGMDAPAVARRPTAAMTRQASQQVHVEPAKSSWQLRSEHGSRWGQRIYRRFSPYIEWWAGLTEPERTGPIPRFVLSNAFGTLCAAVISANAIFLIASTNRDMETRGAPVGVVYSSIELSFVCFFTWELAMKMITHRIFYFCNQDMTWNIFDLILVMAAWFELAMAESASATMFRPMRVLKMAKILRVARLMHFFPILSMMLSSLIGSLSILFWSMVMLTFMFYLFAVALVQGVSAYMISEPSIDGVLEFELLKGFGTVQRAMLRLYQVAFGGLDWAEVYDLMEECGIMNSALFILFVSLMNIAILNILTGIFVECALKLAQPDREYLACERRMQQLTELQEFRMLFCEIQKLEYCPPGYVTRSAFMEAAQQGRIRAHLEVLGLNLKDPEASFATLAQSSMAQQVDMDTFIQGCMNLRGPALNLDVNLAVRSIQDLQDSQVAFQEMCLEKLAALSPPQRPHKRRPTTASWGSEWSRSPTMGLSQLEKVAPGEPPGEPALGTTFRPGAPESAKEVGAPLKANL